MKTEEEQPESLVDTGSVFDKVWNVLLESEVGVADQTRAELANPGGTPPDARSLLTPLIDAVMPISARLFHQPSLPSKAVQTTDKPAVER